MSVGDKQNKHSNIDNPIHHSYCKGQKMASKKLGRKKFLSFERKAFELFTADTKNYVEVTISLPTFVLLALRHVKNFTQPDFRAKNFTH